MFDSIEKLEDVCLKDFCTFKIGGIGKIIVFPKNVLELKSVLKECKNNNLKYFILGMEVIFCFLTIILTKLS